MDDLGIQEHQEIADYDGEHDGQNEGDDQLFRVSFGDDAECDRTGGQLHTDTVGHGAGCGVLQTHGKGCKDQHREVDHIDIQGELAGNLPDLVVPDGAAGQPVHIQQYEEAEEDGENHGSAPADVKVVLYERGITGDPGANQHNREGEDGTNGQGDFAAGAPGLFLERVYRDPQFASETESDEHQDQVGVDGEAAQIQHGVPERNGIVDPAASHEQDRHGGEDQRKDLVLIFCQQIVDHIAADKNAGDKPDGGVAQQANGRCGGIPVADKTIAHADA